MADLDPQTIAEMNDNIALMNSTMRALTGTLGDLNRTLGGTSTAARQSAAADRDAAAAAEAAAAAAEAEAEAAIKSTKAMQDLSMAFSRASGIVGSFATALLSGERSFAKYNDTLGQAGDAAFEFGKSLGPIGAILGGIVKAGTMVAQAYTKQADDLLKASDDISKMGAANAFSAEQIRQMGKRAGLASDQLDKMIKPMQSMSGGLTLLGATSADGVKKFGEMIAVSKETRMAFQRLGLSEGELIQAQADYIGMIERTGGALIGQQKTGAALQKASLEYTQNLYELSAITGKSLEESKKEMEINRASIQFKIQENKWATEYAKAQANRDTEAMARIEAEKKAANALINDVSKLGDPAKTAAVQMQLLTGAVTKESAQFATLGVNIDDQIRKVKEGNYQAGEFNDAYKKGAQRFIDGAGASVALSESLQKATGLNEKSVSYLNKRMDVEDEVAAATEARAALEANKAGEGAAAQDQAQQTRNALTEAERSAKLALDELVASTNPLLKSYDDLDIKMKAFIVALGVATAALGVAGLVKGVNALKTVLGGGGGDDFVGPPDPRRGGGKGLLKTGARFLGKAAIPVAGALAAYDAYQGFTADQDATLGQKLKNAGSSALSGLTFGLMGSSPEEIAARKAAGASVAAPVPTKEDLEKQKRDLERRKIAEEGVARDQNISEEERDLAKTKLRAIAIENAFLENKIATMEFQNAKTPEEKAAAIAKSDRARKTIQQNRYAEQLEKLQDATSEAETKAAEEGLVKARTEMANIEIWRATQQLNTAKTEIEKEEAQAKIEAAKKGLEQAKSDITALTSKKAEEVSKGGKIEVATVTKDFAGGYADGGVIPSGKIGLVGERGPELISGPATITNIQNLLGTKSFEQLSETGFKTEKVFSEFSKDLTTLNREDPIGKMNKQLKTVNEALGELNDLIDPNTMVGGPNLTGGSGLLSSVLSGIRSSFRATAGGGSGAGTIFSPGAGGGGGAAPGGISGLIAAAFQAMAGIDGESTGGDIEGNVGGGGGGPSTRRGASRGPRKKTEGLIVHHTGGRGLQNAVDTLKARGLGYHYLVDRDGSVVNVVPDNEVALHAGKTDKKPALSNRNSVSISLVAKDDKDLTKTQAEAAVALGRSLMQKYGMSMVYGHGETSSHKHADEGKTIASLLRGGGRLPSDLPQARLGGLLSGPESGFPAMLHGQEIVVPLDPNSILAELGTKSKAEVETEITRTRSGGDITSNFDGLKEIASQNQNLMELLSDKLDSMINRLDTSNDTQTKILRVSQV